ncbi:hypothetical protein [Flavobacterium reichenbachii]|uniref:2-dehydro-3-deoxyphosphooctonate aldolase n=1 Tax=Flavobacterium reichenbachii TaxID=362418 RepID=A0A085ZQ74_9FLAO|nr:hypothetical protein [Flavobacterium reichenbachii]KFF06588.1 2-dehydro-3-deoxyphosphooctonate aldolase [Flavobacterium reichenbachii]OXB18807.1 2-dehydro-3-deoxyphosphooctonate aldolase [Flavobacterium reichenbachii]
MRKLILAIAVVSILNSCNSTKNSNTVDTTYGYTEKNAVKVGGDFDGPKNEKKYLNSLTGPNGEEVSFSRLGSCCAFETKNSSFGGGMLDKYAVSYKGKKDTVTLYINMYDKTKLKAPDGFKLKD